MRKLTIATRGSRLAIWQAEHIKSRLMARYADLPGFEVELLVLKTRGDVILDAPLAKIGGKGLFVKEIEDALLGGKADLAVHSMKDMPMSLPDGLCLAAVPEREISTDLFLSEKYADLSALPYGAVLGTSSLRRQAQVLALRADLEVRMLRGNVETRLRKMKEGQYDAIVLAAAGVKRLDLRAAFARELAPPDFLPAVGQGALGVEVREDCRDVLEMTSFLNHQPSRVCVEAERAFLAALDGGCQVPIAARSVLRKDRLELEGLVARPNAAEVLRRTLEGPAEQAADLGRRLAEKLLSAGADRILAVLYQ